MGETDLLKALKESYREVSSNGRQGVSLSSIRRYLRYALDILDLYSDIQRDRRFYK